MFCSARRVAIALALCVCAFPQVIEYESDGLKYQTLTRQNLTVIAAPLPARVRGYSLIQVAISNGSDIYASVKPQDFTFICADGTTIQGANASSVVAELNQKGNLSDVVSLVKVYESALYGMKDAQVANAYEQRRESFMSHGSSTKFEAASAASILALVPTRLAPSQSTDGALFIALGKKTLSGGRLIFRFGSQLFEFHPVS